MPLPRNFNYQIQKTFSLLSKSRQRRATQDSKHFPDLVNPNLSGISTPSTVPFTTISKLPLPTVQSVFLLYFLLLYPAQLAHFDIGILPRSKITYFNTDVRI